MNIWGYDDPSLLVLERADQEGFHAPVLSEEVLALLDPRPGQIFLDGTAGGGGHSELILEQGAHVIALDQDPDALSVCARRLERFEDHLRLFRANFSNAGAVLDSLGVTELDGALLDLGVSSHQLDTAERGFSFLREGPLDMRMDPGGSLSAAVLVNTSSQEDLARIFRDYGEEPLAARIAAGIVRAREEGPLRTTRDLALAVERVAPRSGPRHPATRIFQALRIAVNDELEVLRRGLEVLSTRLAPGGRLAVITFHSLEDRIVKHFFRDHAAEWIDRPEWPAPRRNPHHIFRLLTPRPLDASPKEITANPRARSAKLRVAQRLEIRHEHHH